MSVDESISRWILELREGRSSAATRLFTHYRGHLVRLAARKLGAVGPPVLDADDLVLSVLKDFFLLAREGRFPELQSRHDLWPLLGTMVGRKASNYRRAHTRQKRGGGMLLMKPLPTPELDEESDIVDPNEPDPQQILIMLETLEHLLRSLDEELRRILLCKLHGYSNEEIAAVIGRSVPTVERRLRLIRRKCEQHEAAG